MFFGHWISGYESELNGSTSLPSHLIMFFIISVEKLLKEKVTLRHYSAATNGNS